MGRPELLGKNRKYFNTVYVHGQNFFNPVREDGKIYFQFNNHSRPAAYRFYDVNRMESLGEKAFSADLRLFFKLISKDGKVCI